MSQAFYNEHDHFAAQWLRNLIDAGEIAPGVVDERDIQEITEDDLEGFTQVHLFAGIGGWSLALRLAGWGDDRPVWTGSCPCQPFSPAGERRGGNDPRHLWPQMFRLIRKRRPATVFGEQVASAIRHGWLDGICDDLEAEGYACGAIVLPACSVGAPHIRQRLWWMAHADNSVTNQRTSSGEQSLHHEHGSASGLALTQSLVKPGAAQCGLNPEKVRSTGTNESASAGRSCGACGVGNSDESRSQGYGGAMRKLKVNALLGRQAALATGTNSTSFTAETGKLGALNPAHSRWLMGYPPAWDAYAATATRSTRKSRKNLSEPA